MNGTPPTRAVARRVTQIQAVTHVFKATHPDARGASLHVTPSDLPRHAEIGSHLPGDGYAEDIVGNAAAQGAPNAIQQRHIDHSAKADPADGHGVTTAIAKLGG